jgi:hypothetical protein
MVSDDHGDIRALAEAFDAIERDARALVDGLTAPQGIWRLAPGSWSIAECFVNPFIRGIRFSLATGLHVIAAHEHRHLWQAWNVRNALHASNQRT